MPAPEHLRVVHSGVFLGDNSAVIEIWSFSYALGVGDGFVVGSSLEDIATAARTSFTTNLASQLRNYCRLTRTRVSNINDQGKTFRLPSGAFHHFDDNTGVTGTGATGNPLPLQNALAVTLQSDTPGLVGRGRFYLPAPAALQALDATFRLSTNAASGVGTAVKTYLAAVVSAAQPQGVGPVVVASGGSVTQGIPAALRPVTSIRVGRTPDTISSRRGDLPEEHVAVAV